MASDETIRTEDPRSSKVGVGRRKQFKPVRVCVSSDGSGDDGEKVNGGSPHGGKRNIAPLHDPGTGGHQPIVCPDCGLEAQSAASLIDHIDAHHRVQTSETTSTFPTPYHRLARELQKSNASTQLEKNASKIDKFPAPMAEAPAIRLTPEKEESPVSLVVSPMSLKSLKSVDVVNGTDLVRPQNGHSKDHADAKMPTKSSTLGDFGPNFLERVVEEEMAKGSPVLEVAKSSPKPTTPNAQPPLPQPNNSELFGRATSQALLESEDFCNLCKKHFCNKYYLRKHKLDVHGISSETSHQPPPLPSINNNNSGNNTSNNTSNNITNNNSNEFIGFSATESKHSPSTSVQVSSEKMKPSSATTDGQRFTESLASIMNGLPFGLPFSPDVAGGFLFPQGVQTTASQSNGLFNGAPGISNLASIMLLNPFISPLSLLKNTNMLQPSNPNPSSLNTLAELQNFGLSGSGSLLNDSSPKNSLVFPRFPAPEASANCDLCQKEFCSTYFLKIHKRDKHGIPLEEMAGQTSLKKQTNAGKAPPMYSVDGIEPGENITPLSKLRADDKSHYLFASKKHEETCFLCKQQFASRYSLMMHLLTSHNVKPEGFGLASELMQMEMMTNSQVPFASRSASGSKTSERVACNICNKEVCNKYFLKTHKLKVHGIQDVQSDPPPPPPPLPPPPAQEPSKVQGLSGLSGSQSDPWNLSLDQLMQKYDEIAKQFNVSAPSEFIKKGALDLKMESPATRKDSEVSGKSFARSYNNNNNIDSASFLKGAGDKSESFPNMFGSLDLIAKNKMFDYKGADYQGMVANQFGLLDMPHQSFKSMSSTPAGKNKAAGFMKHFSVKEGKSSDDGAVKLGYDPEAYCEICKKEFCSKYFLKTHKQKIHGLRYEGASDSKSPSLTQNSQSANPTSSGQFAADFSFEGTSGGRGKDPLPSNMTRVTCEICGKELCNKYFLRTHMLKIHGISDPMATTRVPQIDPNKQEINNAFARKESPVSTEIPGLEQPQPFLQQQLQQKISRSSQAKQSEPIQTQNVVIGVKELKQVTEMLLQSTENSSSFDDLRGQQEQPDGRGILTSKEQKNEASMTRLLDKDAERIDLRATKSSSIALPPIPPDVKNSQWRGEFQKVQNFMNNRQQDQLELNRKRKLMQNDLGEMKNAKKFAANFMEKENEKSNVQGRFNSFQAIDLATRHEGDFPPTERGTSEATQVPAVDNCIMQPFELQETSSESSFAQCKVFLPVVQPICEPITLKFTVTPVDH